MLHFSLNSPFRRNGNICPDKQMGQYILLEGQSALHFFDDVVEKLACGGVGFRGADSGVPKHNPNSNSKWDVPWLGTGHLKRRIGLSLSACPALTLFATNDRKLHHVHNPTLSCPNGCKAGWA